MVFIISLVLLLVAFIYSYRWKKIRWRLLSIALLVVYVGNLVYWTLPLSEVDLSSIFIKPQLSFDELRNSGFVNFMAVRWLDLVSFVPVGLLLSCFFHNTYPPSKRISRSLIISLWVCLLFEAIHYLCTKSVDTIVDVELNAFGCLIGVVIHHVYLSNLGSTQLLKRIQNKNRYDRKILCRLIWDEIKDERIIWILVVLSLIFPYLSFGDLEGKSGFFRDLRTMFNNLSYSYVAGVIFYVFSSLMPRVRKLHKAKKGLQEAYSSIFTNYVIVADLLNCIDGEDLCNDADKRIITELMYSPNNQKDSTPCNLFDKFKHTLSEFFSCDDIEEINDNEFAVSLNKVKEISALFKMNSDKVEESVLLYSDVLNTLELNDLNGFKHCFDKLFYSMITQATINKYFVVQKADIEYFASDFILKYKKAERLKLVYRRYSFYAMN